MRGTLVLVLATHLCVALGGLAGEEGHILSEQQKQEVFEELAEEKALQIHKLDSLSLMIYVVLLIITVLTVWLFKHQRFRFFHESGFTLLYGLLIGLLLRVLVTGNTKETVDVRPVNESITLDYVPDFLRVTFTTKDGYNVTLPYELQEGLMATLQGQKDENENIIQDKTTFSPEVFFNILLPPIIFNAGYSLKKRHFFRNIGTILTFALLGTTISCIIVGYVMYGVVCALGIQSTFTLPELMFFGALISATDPVTVLAIFTDMRVEMDLFAVVFGESVLNDAVAIVLTKTIEPFIPQAALVGEGVLFDAGTFFSAVGRFVFVFSGSFGIGALVGCVCALVTKYTKIMEYPLLETSIFLLMSYLSYLLAEACDMTGIVAVLFCGICQAHYTYNNMSEESQSRTKQFFEVVNFLAENFIFMYIGVSMFTSTTREWSFWFVLGSLGAIIIARCAHIYPLSFLLNLRRNPKLPYNYQHMLVFSGLRGAIAFALAIRNTASHARQIIYTTTSFLVIFTVIVNGGLTQFVVDQLKIRHGIDDEQEMQHQFQPVSTSEVDNGPITDRAVDHRRSVDRPYNPWDKAFLPRKWYNFDSAFMKPLLTHHRPSLMETCCDCCMPVARMLTTTEQMMTPDEHGGAESDLNLNQHDGNADTTAPAHLSRSQSTDINLQGDLGLGEDILDTNIRLDLQQDKMAAV